MKQEIKDINSFNVGFPINSIAIRGEKIFLGGGKPNDPPTICCYSNTEGEYKLLAKTELENNSNFVSSMAIHPKERIIACGINNSRDVVENGENKSCKILKFKNNEFQLEGEYPSHKSTDFTDFQNNTKFNSTGTRLLTAGTDGIITMFDTIDYSSLFQRDQGEKIIDTDFNEAGSLAVSISKKRCVIFKASNGSIVYEISNPYFNGKKEALFTSIRFGKMETNEILYIIANIGLNKSLICTLDTTNWEKLASKSVLNANIKKIEISPDGLYLVYLTVDNKIGVIDATTLKKVSKIFDTTEINDSDDIITSISFTKNSNEIVIGTDGGRCQIQKMTSSTESNIKYVLIIFTFIVMLLILMSIIFAQKKINKKVIVDEFRDFNARIEL